MSSQLTALYELSPGLQIGEFDSSNAAKTYRVELSTGVHFQVNDKVYQLLSSLDSPLTLVGLAAEFQQRTGQSVALDQLQQLCDRFVGQGLLVECTPDGRQRTSQPAEPPAPNGALLGLHYRRDLFAAKTLAPIANALTIFFYRPVAIVLMTLVALAHILAYRVIGFHWDIKAIQGPFFYLLLLVSVVIHELGHLAACRRWNCPHGPLGVGLYFLNPVFYVDVTAAWRLSRHQRAVVDLGGLYLQLLCAPLFWLGFLFTHDATYLYAIAVIDMVLLFNFIPMMKLDGYWLLSDLAGVPNLHARTGEVITYVVRWVLWRLGRLPMQPEKLAFAQWPLNVRLVVIAYVVLSLLNWPLMLLMMAMALVSGIATYPAVWQAAIVAVGKAFQTHHYAALLPQFNALFLPILMVLNVIFVLKTVWDRRRKARAAKALHAAKPTLVQQPA